MHVSFLLCSFSKSNAVVKSTMDPIEPPWSCWAPHLLTNLIQETHQLFVPLEQRCQDEKHAASKRWQLKSRYARIWNLSWRIFFRPPKSWHPSSCVLFFSWLPNNQERGTHVFHALWTCFQSQTNFPHSNPSKTSTSIKPHIPPRVFLCCAQTWTNCVICRLTVKVEAIDVASTSSGLGICQFGSQKGCIFATWN